MMAENSKISWTTHTFNPWIGCTKVHAGCTHCYAERDMDTRRGRVKWGPTGTRSRTTDSYWRQPLKWNREAAFEGERTRVFCASLADVFEDWQGEIHGGGKDDGILAIDDNRSRLLTMDDMRADLFRLIDATPNLDWLLLTKRPENIRRMWCSHANTDGLPPSNLRRENVWLLTSVSDQATANVMVPQLLKARDLTPVLGVSAEPLLGPVDFSKWLLSEGRNEWWPDDSNAEALALSENYPSRMNSLHVMGSERRLDWIITGGESGPHARPHDIRWSWSIGEQCKSTGVAWFHKQMGSFAYDGGRPLPFTAPFGLKEVENRLRLNDRAGADSAEWGEGWLQQMPIGIHA